MGSAHQADGLVSVHAIAAGKRHHSGDRLPDHKTVQDLFIDRSVLPPTETPRKSEETNEAQYTRMISVAMITMNEEKAVARVIEDIRDALNGREFEIVVVDSSRDATPSIAAGQGARVIRQFPPQGYGRAMARVLRESHGDVVVTLDCDGTYPASEIPRLADMVLSGQCDLVNASRLERRPQTMPLANYLANWFFAIAGRVLVGVQSTDLHSGMRAYSHRVIHEVDFDPNGPALPVELLLKPALEGFRVREVFIPYGERIGETTLQRWSSTVWTFRRILRLAVFRFTHLSKRASPADGNTRSSCALDQSHRPSGSSSATHRNSVQ
jgi:glycosyltransferase involved in cell wall biosynthesis